MQPRAKILMIDDDPTFLRATTLALQLEYEVISMTDPCWAVSLLDQVHVIIFDYKMQFTDGAEILRRVKEARILAPVILVTAYADKEVAMMAANLHVFAILEKPVKYVLFMATVKDAAHEYRRRQKGLTHSEKGDDGVDSNQIELHEPTLTDIEFRLL
ncbi:response regulator [Bdellovibrionota bacterium FG-1]